MPQIRDDNRLKLTVKRVEGGLVSNFIVDELDEGDEVTVLKPAGEFNCIDCKPSTTKKVTLVSCRLRYYTGDLDGEVLVKT